MPEYELVGTSVAQFEGRCVVDQAHPIRKRDTIGRVRRADNPYADVKGFACKRCVGDLPRAKR